MLDRILLVLTEGFDDYAFLSCQVILEENNFDIIISSKVNGTIKGVDSSVMTVSLSEVISEEIDFKGVILVGGNDMNNWDELDKIIGDFYNFKKVIGAIKEGIHFMKQKYSEINFSEDDNISTDDFIITLMDPDNTEDYINEFIKLIS